jgi:pimeloyl-ACP methyl ester carboxylesterase
MSYAGNVHYREYHGGVEEIAPLVLIHGAGGSIMHWPSEIRRMHGVQTLAIDLPGHGESRGSGEQSIDAYSQTVIAFLDDLGIGKAVIAGHSMGSAIAQTLYLEYPKRVLGLILLGAGAKLRVHPDILQFCANEVTFPKAVSIVMEWAFSQKASERLVELAGQRLAETSPDVVEGDFLACDTFDVRERLKEIQTPTLVICGAEDILTPVRFSEFLAERIPNAHLEIVPDAGHMVMLEQPEIVANLMKEFLMEIGLDTTEVG